MPAEIELKFLVCSFPNNLLKREQACFSRNGYLSSGLRTERVRTVMPFPDFEVATPPEDSVTPSYDRDGWQAFHDIKTRNSYGDWKSQTEDTEEITLHRALYLLQKASDFITKVRYQIPGVLSGEQVLEIDFFTKLELRGLVILEVELKTPEEEVFLPEGFDVVEVTEDTRFLNANLAKLTLLEELGLEEMFK